jgi:hypothetical protein
MQIQQCFHRPEKRKEKTLHIRESAKAELEAISPTPLSRANRKGLLWNGLPPHDNVRLYEHALPAPLQLSHSGFPSSPGLPVDRISTCPDTASRDLLEESLYVHRLCSRLHSLQPFRDLLVLGGPESPDEG